MSIRWPLLAWAVLGCPLAFAAPAGATYCNPLNLDYGWSGRDQRHSADPVIVPFQGRYYLFATDDVPGYRVSDDLLTWSNILFSAGLRALMSDNDRGTYCAPAVASDGKRLYFIRMSRRKEATVPVMCSADPAAGRWKRCGTLRAVGDPALFFDDDGRAWLYHGLGKPTKVFAIDTNTWTEVGGSEVQLRPEVANVTDLAGGYERGRRELLGEADTGAWCGRFKILPCQEAAWMTKHKGRYYLQYATPGTVTQWYGDVALEGAAPTGPFTLADYSPVSLKIGGFIGSAGHSCVFQDFGGRWWRVTTMWVGVRDLFERRLGLFPVGFDAAGRMFTDTALGDYPRQLADGAPAGWWVQSFRTTCTASSSLTNHPPALAGDENVRTWWSARSGDPGEWFKLDLGAPCRINAVQVNFAEQDAREAVRGAADYHAYRLLLSDDGVQWRTLVDRSGSHTCAPHDYVALAAPVTGQYLRLENVHTANGGKFAVRDLRVFGRGSGRAPAPVTDLKVARHADDDRNVTLRWTPAAGASGYLVRYGVAPDALYTCIQVQDGGSGQLTFHALARGVQYHWRVDAFNGNGVTVGPDR